MSASRTAIGVSEPDHFEGALIEISVGAGGADAVAFVADLLHMYRSYSENQGWRTEIMLQRETDNQGLKRALLRVIGEDTYPKLKHETGTQRVQRVPGSEKQGRIHTSTASVVVMPIPAERFRLEKIRTYNFPDDEVRDHRHKVKVGDVRRVLGGDVDSVLSKLPDNS
jgi:peptide chain release factor 1